MHRDPSVDPVLAVNGASKAFGHVQALADVSLKLAAGSVHALIGRNGSGKSTLVKILTGYHRSDRGEIRVRGELVEPWRQSLQDTGIAVVHQDLGVFSELSVLENFAIGRGYSTRRGLIDWKGEERLTRAALDRFGIGDVAREPLSALPQVHAVIVAMARALESASSAEKSVLILDEPTSFLPRRESGMLFAAMRQAAEAGMGILFITHQLGEVIESADVVTVLRDGRVALSAPTKGVAEHDLVAAMMGDEDVAPGDRSPDGSSSSPTVRERRPVIRLRGVSGETLTRVDLDVYAGELVGVTGLLASGLDELTYILAGHSKPISGSVELSPSTRNRRALVGLVPGNRVRSGTLTGLNVEENLSVSSLTRRPALSWLSRRQQVATASDWIERLGVRRGTPTLPMESLSGGNQQKVILARWLSCRPDLLVAEGPTQGIDVRAKADVLRSLREATAKGIAVVVVSYEAEEIVSACDRVVVLRGGSVAAEMHRGEVETPQVLEAMG
jgi:ribose transport system ATP-binding protein